MRTWLSISAGQSRRFLKAPSLIVALLLATTSTAAPNTQATPPHGDQLSLPSQLHAMRSITLTDATARSVPGKFNLLLGTFDIASVGYVGQEFFISGQATSFTQASPFRSDGQWTAVPVVQESYTTRIVVLQPMDSSKFNGTVIVEWLNVTGGLDAPADWIMAHREMVRDGYVYVAVSAQRVGVEGGPSRGTDMSLKKLDAERYGDLHHPGDAFAFDIYSQAGRLVRDHSAALGLPEPSHILAVGESQSAMFLTTYINAIDPLAKVFDGFLVHSRFAPAAPLDGSSVMDASMSGMPDAPRLRTNLRVPVMTFITETDLLGGPRRGFHVARQPDNERLRVWEVAGTAHADNYTIQVGFIDSGLLPVEQLAAAYAPTSLLMGAQLPSAINFAPQHHYVLQAALVGLNRWVRDGVAPPEGSQLILAQSDPAQLSVDANGVALGGIRTPWVDVPVARTSGVGDASSAMGILFGSGEPLDDATLERLYPDGLTDYLTRFETSLDASISAGFLLPSDRTEILALATAMYPEE